MRKSNYAFVSALYANRTRGLYTDIYFPIIKYALTRLFVERHDSHVYHSAEDVANFIEKRFGFRIPTIVIARSVVNFGNKQTSELSLVIYENGNSFQINRAELDGDEMDLEDKEQFFSEKLDEIERKYQEFISQQGCFDDGVTFVQFITANTDEVLGYFEGENKSCVDEGYTTLIQFLQYIHDADRELYKVAHQLFWSSIIVAFLKSEKPMVDDLDNGTKAEYYLDTSIVLGLLDLSTSLKESYSKDVRNIILNSGGLLRVHPMTLEEVRRILSKVEQNGPYPLTDIADAYSRRNMIPNHLAKIRLNIEKTLAEMHIDILPQMSPEKIQKATLEYTGKEVTKLLGKMRWKNSAMNYVDNFREIHDVYMDSYIKERRKAKGNAASVYFLTNNVDLINFCKAQHEAECYMMSTGQLILNLWMHNKQSIDVSDCILTEAMARCIGLHKSNVRYKIAEVARFYNQTKDDFDPQVYKEFVGHLYRRAKNAIAAAEQIKADGAMPQSMAKLIKEAVDKDNEAYNNSLTKVKKETTELRQETAEKDRLLGLANSEIEKLEKNVKDTGRLAEDLETERRRLDETLQRTNTLLDRIRTKRELADATITLYRGRDALLKEKNNLSTQFVPLEKERKASFTDWKPVLFLIIGALFIAMGVAVVISVVFASWNTLCLSTLSLIVPVGLYALNRWHALNEKKEERANKAYAKWEAQNPLYRQLVEDLEKINEKLDAINAKLNQ